MTDLLLLACLCLAGFLDASNAYGSMVGEEGYSCDNVKAVPEAQRCQFVSKECPSDSRVPYTEWYYCSVAPHGILARGAFMVLLTCVLPLLFSLLGNTAELYFSPTMSLVSQTIPKMRPRFAGVTFVAIGNGAPDLSANISAIRSGQVALSAGAFTGAAMFVQCVVASEVIRISKGVVCKGAVLRDVGTFGVSITGVGLCFYSGVITHWFVVGAVLVYIVYASWVFVGDEWHAAGRPALQPDRVTWDDLRALLFQRQYSRGKRGIEVAGSAVVQEQPQYAEALLPWAPLEVASGDQAGKGKAIGPGIGGGQMGSESIDVEDGVVQQRCRADQDRGGHAQRYLDSRTYMQAVWADLEEPLSRQQQLMGRLLAVELQGSNEGGGASKGSRSLTPESLHLQYQPPSLEGTPEQSLSQAHRASTGRTYSTEMPFSLCMEAGGGTVSGAEAPSSPGPQATALVNRSSCNVQSIGIQDLAAGHVSPESVLPDAQLVGGAEVGREHGWLVGPCQGYHQHPQQGQQQGDPSPRQGGGPHGHQRCEPTGWRRRWFEQIKQELTLGESAEWHELPHWQWSLREFSFCCLLPAYAAQRATIPQVDPASYSQQWLVVSMLCSPLAVLVYFDAYSTSAVLTALAVGCTLAMLVHVLTKDEEDLPTLDLGTRFAFGPAILSLAGFFMGVLWIDTLASEVVGIVSLVSRLMGMPPSFVGLTLLAVGSSLGDFFGNPSMARRGHSSTALTACFAGPLFNMLISMAAGFSSYFAREGITRTSVQFTPDIALGVVCLVTYNIIVAIVGLVNNSRIPEKFYLFARVWYGVYIFLACILGMKELWAS